MLIELQTQARPMIRKLGLVPLLDRFRSVRRVGYEDAFSRSSLVEIRPNDCVWDVGANVGYYSQRIASRVVAFEPVPETFSRLSRLALHNTTFVNAAFTREDVLQEQRRKIKGVTYEEDLRQRTREHPQVRSRVQYINPLTPQDSP
jgi:hypothetical protein